MFIDFIEEYESQASTGLMVAEAGNCYRMATEGEILRAAEDKLLSKVRTGPMLTTLPNVKDFLRVRIGALDHEEFFVMYLDGQHRLITTETLFRGTLMQTTVYPRELAVQALKFGAAALIVAHNHPSGEATPSRADERLTSTLRVALDLLDIRLLDHYVVTPTQAYSFAEHGMI